MPSAHNLRETRAATKKQDKVSNVYVGLIPLLTATERTRWFNSIPPQSAFLFATKLNPVAFCVSLARWKKKNVVLHPQLYHTKSKKNNVKQLIYPVGPISLGIQINKSALYGHNHCPAFHSSPLFYVNIINRVMQMRPQSTNISFYVIYYLWLVLFNLRVCISLGPKIIIKKQQANIQHTARTVHNYVI